MKNAATTRRGTARLTALATAGTMALAALVAACGESSEPGSPTGTTSAAPSLTLGSGTQSVLVGRATFAEAFKVKRKTGDWEVDVHAKDPLDVAVQTITFLPGSQSGWHSHPGPVFIQVVSGTVTFYESNDPTCTPIVRTAGQGYLDAGDHAHIARNETGEPAKNVVTYFAPPGAALRIDEPAPGNCPF